MILVFVPLNLTTQIVTLKESFVSAAREGLIPKSIEDIEVGLVHTLFGMSVSVFLF